MATTTVRRRLPDAQMSINGWYRLGALVGLLAVTGTLVSTLYEITVILGGSAQLLARVGLAIGAAWIAARVIRPRMAVAIFGLVAVVGYLWYLSTATADPWLAIRAPLTVAFNTINDTIRIVTGMSVLTIQATDVWALAFAPAPVFLSWYLGFRRHYVAAAALTGAAMGVFVLSGDLELWWTLIGVIGIVSTVGFGELEGHSASTDYAEILVVVIAVMAVGAVAVPVVPGGGVSGPLSLVGGDDITDPNASSIQSSVLGADAELSIVGEIELSPEVRYTIESDDNVYWRTGVYDRYTGEGWVRTGTRASFNGPQPPPGPNTTTVEQRVRIEARSELMPAAAQPVVVTGVGDVEQTDQGAVVANDPLDPGTTYRVLSAVPDDNLASSGTVPDDVRSSYTQLPEDVPDRVHDVAEQVVSDADGPLANAERIETYLETHKEYSLEISRPSGDITDAFLFEMDAGYCTYFATTMVTMLRSADVPARFAVGYANGQQVAEDRWVVRGLNSHAWVEVYHPDAGWVTFDPTPTARETARSDRVQEARESDHPAVDTDASEDLPYAYDPSTNASEPNASPTPTDPTNESTPPGGPGVVDPGGGFNQSILGPPDQFSGGGGGADGDAMDELTRPIAWERFGLALLVTTGLVTGVARLRPRRRLAHQLTRRWQRPTGDDRTDARLAQDRVEWALHDRFRPRKPAETPRQYYRLISVLEDDPAIERFFEVTEQIRYGGRTEAALVEEAIALADDIVADQTRLGGGQSWPARLGEWVYPR